MVPVIVTTDGETFASPATVGAWTAPVRVTTAGDTEAFAVSCTATTIQVPFDKFPVELKSAVVAPMSVVSGREAVERLITTSSPFGCP